MRRIEAVFSKLKQDGKKGFIPFITAGDPDLNTTTELLLELAECGATTIELGVPFSDPMADGPVIQRASERALRHGFGLQEIFEATSKARAVIATPLVLFSYFNPLLQYGIDKLGRDARQTGIDGILVTDLTPEESKDFAAALKWNDLDMIFLVAPTSTDERLRMITEHASGFVYAVSRAGVTGARENVSREAELLVTRVRKCSSLPVAVGFGISTADQVAEILRYADAAVVGSAIVAQIEKLSGETNLVEKIGQYVRGLIPEGAKRLMNETSRAIGGMPPGTAVVIVLHTPREKCWGVLDEINPAGVFLRGLDLNAFDDWVSALVHNEPFIGFGDLFFPMWRVERISRDEAAAGVPRFVNRLKNEPGLPFRYFYERRHESSLKMLSGSQAQRGLPRRIRT